MKNSGVEWIGEIPEDWEVSRVKNFLSERTGGAWGDEKKNNANDIICLRIADFDYSRFKFNNSTELTIRNYNTDIIEKLLLKKDDILVEKSGGGDKTPVGRAVIFEKHTKALFANFMDRLRVRNNISALFFLYVWTTYYDNKYMLPYVKQTTGIQNLDITSILSSVFFPLPPKSTQQRIASYLDKKCSKIEETIQNQQQVIEKLKAYKQSLITEAVTGKVKIVNGKACGEYESYKDSGVEWLGKIPSGWEVGKFGRFAQVKSNLVDPNLYLEYPQIAPDNIGKGSGKLIDWQTVKDSGVISWNHLFFKGQIVYSKIRPTLNKLIIAPFDGLCSADMYPIETNMYKQYFVYMMLSQYFVEQVGLITRDRVKMPKINQNELSGILITVPTKDEQKSIAGYLDNKCTAIDTAIEQKQKLIEKLTEYKKSLIYECVTGKKEI